MNKGAIRSSMRRTVSRTIRRSVGVRRRRRGRWIISIDYAPRYGTFLLYVGHFFAPRGEKMTYKGKKAVCVKPTYLMRRVHRRHHRALGVAGEALLVEPSDGIARLRQQALGLRESENIIIDRIV